MALVNRRRETRRQVSPEQLEDCENQKGFSGGKKKRGNNIAGPMCPEINTRIAHRQGDDPIEPAVSPIKERQNNCDYRVIHHVPGGKRWSGAGSIRFIGVTDRGLVEQGQEQRPRLLQLHHAHGLNLFWAVPIECAFQYSGELFGHEQRQKKANNASARFETAEADGDENNQEKQRFPNLGVADRGHEQIERRICPPFVDEMKDRLIHLVAGHDKTSLESMKG